MNNIHIRHLFDNAKICIAKGRILNSYYDDYQKLWYGDVVFDSKQERSIKVPLVNFQGFFIKKAPITSIVNRCFLESPNGDIVAVVTEV